MASTGPESSPSRFGAVNPWRPELVQNCETVSSNPEAPDPHRCARAQKVGANEGTADLTGAAAHGMLWLPAR